MTPKFSKTTVFEKKKKKDINTAFSTAPLLFTLFAVQNFHSLSRITQNLLDSSLP